MAVNWALGLQQGNAGDAFAQAFQQGQVTNRQNAARSAMAALTTDPTNQRALQALAQADPQAAQQFQQQHAQQAMQALDQHRENIVKGAEIIRQLNPRDDASWQNALQIAQQAGIDVSQVPPHFDPQYAQGLVSLADAFAPQKPEGTASVQDYEYAVKNGFKGSFVDYQQVIHPPSAVTVPAGATVMQPGQQQPITATGPNGQKIQLNPQTGQWEPVGGAGGNASGGFPQ